MADVVRVQGAREVARELRSLAKTIDHMQPTALEGAELIQHSAQGFARVRTGRMRDSIRIHQTADGAQVVAGEGINSVYPAVQEYGSRRRGISPNRYMARAMDDGEPQVVNLVETEVARAADKVKGA